jgi:hypothetical protein
LEENAADQRRLPVVGAVGRPASATVPVVRAARSHKDEETLVWEFTRHKTRHNREPTWSDRSRQAKKKSSYLSRLR